VKMFLDYAMSGFWPFVGCWILVCVPFTCVFRCWNRYLRHRNIAARGWPPEHCDADGDFATPPEREEVP